MKYLGNGTLATFHNFPQVEAVLSFCSYD